MNISVAVLLGATIVGGSVAWTGDQASRDTRCAGYLASESGGKALFLLSQLEAESRKESRAESQRILQAEARGEKEKMNVEEFLAKGAAAANDADVFIVGLRMAGCRLSYTGPL